MRPTGEKGTLLNPVDQRLLARRQSYRVAKEDSPLPKPRHPSSIDVPSYLMNFPFTISNEVPNNVWIEELEESDREINHEKVRAQFLDLFNYMAGASLVYLLPSYKEFQDQVYVANLGIYLEHLPETPTIIVSNYKSEPRKGEEEVGSLFFRMMHYRVDRPDTHWEGEADLKYLRDNLYLGGYGIRTDPATYKWMSEKYDMEIVPVLMQDDYLYHFDCLCFPLNSEKVLLGTELLEKKDIRRVEKVAEIVDVPADMCYNGITNSVRMFNAVLCASNIATLEKEDEQFKEETEKVDFLTKVCALNGMEPVLFNLDEMYKSGAMLSCCIMHLNYLDYQSPIV